MNDILIIIDVQPHFITRKDFKDTLENIIREIKKAISYNNYIFFVEFDSLTPQNPCYNFTSISKYPTLDILRNLTKDYNKVFYINKYDSAGGYEIHRTIIDNNITFNNVKVCGLYAEYCVKETVIELATLIYNNKINIIKDSIYSYIDCSFALQGAIDQMLMRNNVSVHDYV